MKSIIKEAGDVLVLNVGTFAFVSLANIEMILKILLLILTLIYTADKYYHHRQERKNGKKNTNK